MNQILQERWQGQPCTALSALRKVIEADHEFEACMGHTVKYYFKKGKKKESRGCLKTFQSRKKIG